MPKADYENIWEGKCRPAVSGAIYADEVAKAREGRFNLVPYDPALKAHVVFDLGWNDKMSIGIVQRHVSSLRVIRYIEDDHKTLDWYSAQLKSLAITGARCSCLTTAPTATTRRARAPKQWMEDLGWSVEIVPNQPVETGIKNA